MVAWASRSPSKRTIARARSPPSSRYMRAILLPRQCSDLKNEVLKNGKQAGNF